MSDKPIIVGESNPYGGDDYYALYPVPDGCSGHRLCCLILGMRRHDYLEAFERTNLVQGKWGMRAARLRAAELRGRLILLGSKVSMAFGVEFMPFSRYREPERDLLVLPHPSGLCRLWGEPDAFRKARAALADFAPELVHLLGRAEEAKHA